MTLKHRIANVIGALRVRVQGWERAEEPSPRLDRICRWLVR